MKIDNATTHRHPHWCDRDHVEDLHSRVIGEVPAAAGLTEVAVTQAVDRLPVVTLNRHETTEIAVEDLAPELADRLARLLITAVAESGGAR